MPKAPPKPWPKLSESLRSFPARPDQCRACGCPADLTHWRECDEDDAPGPVVVTLCQPCADRIVGPHPRLYVELAHREPFPASMLLCLNCRHRDGGRCACPMARFNGGPGMKIDAPSHTIFFKLSVPGESGPRTFYGESTACAGREASDAVLMPFPGPEPRPIQRTLFLEEAEGVVRA